MFTRRNASAFLIGGFTMAGIGSLFGGGKHAPAENFKVKKTDAEWRAQLSPESYYVLREHGTERAGTSPLDKEKRKGVFACAGCGKQLFNSDTKFNSGTGWPSFFQPVSKENVATIEDRSHGMVRTEILCARCDCHLGHVFEDGPKPTGLRYCLNSESLKFKERAGEKK